MPAALIFVSAHNRKGKPVQSYMRVARNALKFADERHAGQFRGDGVTPYIRHPEKVVDVLRRHGYKDGVTLAAAALHDTLEDTKTTKQEIHERFGAAVADTVHELTDEKGVPKELRQSEQFKRIMAASHRAQAIKLADGIANAKDALISPPSYWTPEYKLAKISHWRRLAHGLFESHPKLADELLEILGRFK